jgi:hypothetical protein
VGIFVGGFKAQLNQTSLRSLERFGRDTQAIPEGHGHVLLRRKAGRGRDVGNLRVRIHQKFARQLEAALDDVFVDGLPGVALELLPKGRDRRPDRVLARWAMLSGIETFSSI